ncbi:MFS transporter [Nocardioides mesophilus]|uniref:MFS transporter n=1 Tax=Nocardioides mesophilus TaxID=433659 RepID=UPI001FEAA060|nr:MFS transporter [Nocardioides mesophilus]
MSDHGAPAAPPPAGQPAPRAVPADARALLALAAVSVGFAAADTYVVVLALPDMMAGSGLGIDELQRAAPIISGFLLGYVAVLPLIGRIADLRGRLPVLVGSLVVFALGSLVTAAAYDLPSMVSGRFLQGVGGGGLVPATLALVADLYPPHRRGVPLGVVGAVQEVGSVLGPLYGAVVLAVAPWQGIFALNALVAGALVVALLVLRRRAGGRPGRAGRLGTLPESKSESETGTGTGGAARAAAGPEAPGPTDWPGLVLAGATLLALLLVLLEPAPLATDVTLGLAFVPAVGDSRWTTPLALTLLVLAGALLARCLLAAHPVLDVRRWRRLAAATDVPGALLLALALAGVILAFATADPQVAVFSPPGPGCWPSPPSPRSRSGGATTPAGIRSFPTGPCAGPRPGARWWSASWSAPR